LERRRAAHADSWPPNFVGVAALSLPPPGANGMLGADSRSTLRTRLTSLSIASFRTSLADFFTVEPSVSTSASISASERPGVTVSSSLSVRP
jgi:hypothetical protein